MASLFVLYRDSALRREALRAPEGDPSRYSLYGLDELRRSGFEVRHDLEPAFEPGVRERAEAGFLDRVARLGGGYSGDFARVLSSLAEANRADAVFSTVDTVGIPLALLGRLGRVKRPVVYAAIGLPERLAQLRGGPAKRLFRGAFRRLHTIVAYGWGEVEDLRRWLGEDGPRVEFVAFGVDVEHFRPDPATPVTDDVVSVGADPRRDFALLVELARRLPERSFRIVASADNARELDALPRNVQLETDVPFARVRECLLGAKVVVLPVRENSYSGATTTLRVGHVFCLMHNGNMPDWKTRYSTKLFAEQVMPQLRNMWPDWDGDDRWWIHPLEGRVEPEATFADARRDAEIPGGVTD